MNTVSPTAILRAHAYNITSLDFNSNGGLISSDEGGWCFWWNLLTRRPLAVFRPHHRSIIKVKWMGTAGRIITHGRDNKLYVFQLDESQNLNTNLPTKNDSGEQWLKPLLIHSQDVNALNFCGFSLFENRIFALPSTLSSENVDVYELSQSDNHLYRPLKGVTPSEENVGIVMALVITDNYLVIGYESGHVMFYSWDGRTGRSEIIKAQQPHSQPVLSLAIFKSTVVSTAADQLLVKYDIGTGEILDSFKTGHSGLQSVQIRSDGKILGLIGWDNMIRIFQLSSFKPLAVFKSSSQLGASCVAFSPIYADASESSTAVTAPRSSSLASMRHQKVVNTHWVAVGGKDGRIGLFEIY